jgi:hypothetical protein
MSEQEQGGEQGAPQTEVNTGGGDATVNQPNEGGDQGGSADEGNASGEGENTGGEDA